jgi:NADPH2:quinone reductase
MQRISIRSVGGPEELVIDTAADLAGPGAGQVLVDVDAAGVNYIDVMQRKGDLPLAPAAVLGFEGVGRIRSLGQEVDRSTGLGVGQRVAWVDVPGSYASQLIFDANHAIPVPETFKTEQALLFQALTAEYLVTEYRQVRPGDRVLVHAAAGGVGQLLVQWLKHLGAWVVGTTSNEAKASVARAAGADEVINYGGQYAFYDALMSLTGGRGVDLAFDSVGAATFASSLKSLARGGTVVSCGSSSGLPPAINPSDLVYPCTRIAGGAIFSYLTQPDELQRRSRAVLDAITQGWLNVPPGTVYPFARAAEAHADIERRRAHGKLFLRP